MLTGEQYKESLFDGRATFFEGKRVDDLPNHPILGSCVERVAEGYEWLATQAVDGVSPIMGIPTSPEELRGKVNVVHHAGMMAHVTYTSIMTLATAAGRISGTAPQYVERINAFIEDAQRRDVRITQCITDAKGDRSRPPGKQDDPDAYVHVVDRSAEGVAPSCTSRAPRSATS
jgi:4-hydroxybutyryl-CoA dehydratase/vinylacetyl-CoA-Delta-isomerase